MSRGAWNAALAAYEQAKAEFDRLIAAEEEAGEAVSRAVPRIDCFFDEYGLGIGS